MSAIRIRALRTLVRPTARAAPRTSRTQLVARRYASSGGHGSHEASSDLPWALAAGIVTPVGAYFLWPSASTHAEHGHHDAHGKEHGEEEHADDEEVEEKSEETSEDAGEDSKEAESKDDEPKDEESKDEESKDDKSEEDSKDEESKDDANDDSDEQKEDKKPAKPSGSEGEAQPKTDDPNKKTSGDEEPSKPEKKSGESSVEGVKGKGHMKADAPGNTHEVKSEPDGKGGSKKRIDSGAQKDLGDAASKPQGDMAKKQEGMSNTPTRHSTDIHNSSEKSTKSEGVPDTAKVMGPVDPNRPAK